MRNGCLWSLDIRRTHQVFQQIIPVAIAVVANVIEYAASCMLTQNGGLTKSPSSGSASNFATQKVIRQDVAVVLSKLRHHKLIDTTY